MKKILTFAICLAAVATAAAQVEAVKEASKLAGKPDKIEDARGFIAQALQNEDTMNSADAWFTAGNIEFKGYDAIQSALGVDPSTPHNMTDMGKMLLSGYDYFMTAFPLDQQPNEKGQVKPKHTKDMVKALASHVNDYFNVAGVTFYNEKMYPEAARAFMIFADMPELEVLGKNAPIIADSIRSGAYFYAGVSAYSAKDVNSGIKAFNSARRTGYSEPEAWLYEIACWQAKMQENPEIAEDARQHIYDIAADGNNRFGLEKPIFINNMVDILVSSNKNDEAMALVNQAMEGNEENPAVYALRAYVNDHLGNHEAALNDYRKVGELPGADFESLSRAARHLAREGQTIYNTIEGYSAEMQEKRQDVKVNYFEKSLQIAKRAQELNPRDSKNNDLIDSIEYNLSLIKD